MINKHKQNNFISEKEIRAIGILKKQYGINIENACFAKGWIPKYIILDKTRNIHSYAVFLFESKGKFSSMYSNKSIQLIEIFSKLSKIQFSELDRPLFLFLFDENFKLKVSEIELIKENIFLKKLEEDNFLTFFDSSAYFPQMIKQQL